MENKFKKVYSNYKEYQNLSESDKSFYDWLFSYLWIQTKPVEIPDETLAKKWGTNKNVIQKKMKRLADNNLILRDTKTYKENDRFTKKRLLSLDPLFIIDISNKLDLMDNLKFKNNNIDFDKLKINYDYNQKKEKEVSKETFDEKMEWN